MVHSVGLWDLNSGRQACWRVLLHAQSSFWSVCLALSTCSFGFRRDNPQGSERTRGDQLLTLPAHRSSAAGTLPYNPLTCIFLGLAQSSPCWLLGTFIPDLFYQSRGLTPGFPMRRLVLLPSPHTPSTCSEERRGFYLKLCMS